jgi:hypothetical protein
MVGPRTCHCLVNWSRVQRLKNMGGLRILHLERFNRALHLHWPWLKWKTPSKPWSQMELTLSPTEMALFRACTSITIGDGTQISFWHDRWLEGKAPKDIAPALLRFAWRKNHSVAQALRDGAWMKGLQRISSTAEVHQFINLWNMVTQVQLSGKPNDIAWQLGNIQRAVPTMSSTLDRLLTTSGHSFGK